MTSNEDPASGFSTLEMLVAFVVLSLGLAVAIQAISQATMRLKRANEAVRETELVRRVMSEELPELSKRYVGQPLEDSGPIWRMDLRPLLVGNEQVAMSATVWIQSKDGLSPRSYTSIVPSSSLAERHFRTPPLGTRQ